MRTSLICLAVLLVSASAAASADIPIVEAPAAPEILPERFGWDGVYAGVAIGYGWLEDVDYAPPPGLPNPLYDEGEDWVGGLYAGYLHTFGPIVAGVEAEAVRLDITYDFFNFITITDSFAAKARAGIAWDRFLFTGHGGAVYARSNFNGLKDWGWTAGAGVDYAVTDNITVGGQYTHYSFTEFDGTQIDATIDLVTARIGYKF